MARMDGVSISPGYASGIAIVYDYDLGRRLDIPRREVSRADVESEWRRLDDALEKSSHDLHVVAQSAGRRQNRGDSISLLTTHAAMTSEIASLVKSCIDRELVNAEQALDSVIRDWVERITRLDSEYLRQREQDVRDVGRRMTRYLAGSLPWSKGPLPPGSVIVARELMPSEAVELASCGVTAIVSESGGRYSHTAILARSLGIPAVTGVADATLRIRPGMRLLVDGEAGRVTTAPSPTEERVFAERSKQYETRDLTTATEEAAPCTTRDGVVIGLAANVGRPEEAASVVDSHLDGVGLFRTEFLFLESQKRPSTEMQEEMYSRVARVLTGRPLVIRTFDLGGDKLPPFLMHEPPEKRIGLHLGGLRFSLAERQLLESQLHAILHTAQEADVRVLFPMVIGSDDLAQAVALVQSVANRCGLQRMPSIGAMIETPAALYALEEILDLADFVALGTNDLTQYMLATNRDQAQAEDDCTAMHPAVLRAIKQVSDAASRRQCPVCVCGEEAGDADFACLLVGLGIRDLSVSPPRAAVLRAAIRSIDARRAREVAEEALQCRSPREVRELLAQARLEAPKRSAGVRRAPSDPATLG